jgi:hypothetical protein
MARATRSLSLATIRLDARTLVDKGVQNLEVIGFPESQLELNDRKAELTLASFLRFDLGHYTLQFLEIVLMLGDVATLQPFAELFTELIRFRQQFCLMSCGRMQELQLPVNF